MSRARRTVMRTLERWERPRAERVVGGVCAAIAGRTGVHPLLVRIVFVILALADGLGAGIYALLWLVLPSDGERLARSSLQDAALSRLRHVGDELRTGAHTTARALAQGRGSSTWPRTLDRWWLGAGLALVGAVVLFGSFGLFDWLTPMRALGLAALAVGLGLVLSAGGNRKTSQGRRS